MELKIQKDLYSLRVASKSPVLLDEDINVALTYLEGLLEEKKEMGSNIITLGIVTLDGYRRETTDFERTSYRGDRDWFKAIVAGAPHAFASPGFSSAYPDLLRIPLVVPIYKDGQLYRILHSRLGLNQLVPLMEEMKFGERGRAFVVDRDGIFVAHPSPDLLLESWVEPGEFIPDEIAYYGRKAVAAKVGRIEYTFRGVDSILNFKTIPLTDWIIVTVAERGEFFVSLDKLTRQVIILIIGTSLVLLLFGWYLASKITTPIRNLISSADNLGSGDFNTAITSETKDETGQLANAFEQMRLNIKSLISDVAASATKVANTAQEVMSQAEQTSVAATENASSVNEISATVGDVSDNIKVVAEKVDNASKQADSGQEKIVMVTGTMSEIEIATKQVGFSVNNLSQSITKINDFVSSIESIASQTNLLALNAAIESARAGEAGKGFAVVAGEVRKLAEESVKAAEEVSQIIKGIEQETKQALNDVDTNKEKVVIGTQIVEEVRQSFTTISEVVQELNQNTEEISASTKEVAEASQSVAAATEEQTAIMEEVSASAAELSNIAGEMNSLLEKYSKSTQNGSQKYRVALKRRSTF